MLKNIITTIFIGSCIFFSAAYFLLCSSTINEKEYSSVIFSPYKFPIKQRSETWCIQGNNTRSTHQGICKYSFDFFLFPGSEIFASRQGKVISLLNSENMIEFFDGNYIKIVHHDSSIAIYAHLKYKSNKVNIGDNVKQGQCIGLSGWNGMALYPHLHFHVEKKDKGIPVNFSDITTAKGIPRFLKKY